MKAYSYKAVDEYIDKRIRWWRLLIDIINVDDDKNSSTNVNGG